MSKFFNYDWTDVSAVWYYMPMTTYLIQLEVDAQWLEAIQDLTSEVYDGEICKWLKLDPKTSENING